MSPLVTAARAPALLGAGPVEVVAVEARAHDRRCPASRRAGGERRVATLSMMDTRVALLDQADGQARADPATPDDDDVHRHHATRHAQRRTTHGMCLPEGVSRGPVPEAGAYLTQPSTEAGGTLAGSPPERRAAERHRAPARHRSPGGARGPALLRRPPTCPRTLRYRLKNALLGPPIASERQSTERLGKPTALAVLSSDVISSSAYATEQILLRWSRSSAWPPSPWWSR